MINLEWHKVVSERVAAIAFDAAGASIYVHFPDGPVYRYSECTPHEWAEFSVPETSKGQFINRVLNKKPYRRVDVPAPRTFLRDPGASCDRTPTRRRPQVPIPPRSREVVAWVSTDDRLFCPGCASCELHDRGTPVYADEVECRGICWLCRAPVQVNEDLHDIDPIHAWADEAYTRRG